MQHTAFVVIGDVIADGAQLVTNAGRHRRRSGGHLGRVQHHIGDFLQLAGDLIGVQRLARQFGQGF